MEPYYPQSCKNLKEYLSKVKPFVNNGWMFRGQPNGDWVLKNSFERVCEQFMVAKKDKVRVETNMIREFRRRIHQYTQDVPTDSSIDEFIALMQHHGAPTRLLDFSYSPYVAAYFAFEYANQNSSVSIWAVNYEWCREHLKDISDELFTKYKAYRNSRKGKDFDYIFRTARPENFVLTVNPLRLNERLAYQRGVFLCPSNIEINLMDILVDYTKGKDLETKIIKFVIPTGVRNKNTIEALETLDMMNVSRITLFPGLDGFAQSFTTRIHSLFLRQWGH